MFCGGGDSVASASDSITSRPEGRGFESRRERWINVKLSTVIPLGKELRVLHIAPANNKWKWVQQYTKTNMFLSTSSISAKSTWILKRLTYTIVYPHFSTLDIQDLGDKVTS